jgi:hypothetical protein
MNSFKPRIEFVDPIALDGDDHRFRTRQRWTTTYSNKALRQGMLVDARIVRHDRFNQSIAALDRMFLLGKELRQPIGGVISGPPGVGKTTIFEYYMQTLPQHDLAERSKAMIHLRMRRIGALGGLVQSVLQQLKYPLMKVNSNTVDAKRSLSIDALRRHNTRLILVDEANLASLRRGASSGEGSSISEYFREVMDESNVAVCLAGGSSLADLKQVDPHLDSRCVVKEPHQDFALDADWLGIAQAVLPNNDVVKLHGIHSSRDEQLTLHTICRGNLRRLKQFATELTMVTVDAGKSAPATAHLQLAFARAFGSEEAASCPWK